MLTKEKESAILYLEFLIALSFFTYIQITLVCVKEPVILDKKLFPLKAITETNPKAMLSIKDNSFPKINLAYLFSRFFFLIPDLISNELNIHNKKIIPHKIK